MCQWESGETAPRFEGTGMIQRGSSGGRGRPSTKQKQLQLTDLRGIEPGDSLLSI